MAKHTPSDEQLSWVRAWRDSGESQVAFAHRHDLRLPTLRSWIHRHRCDDRPGGFLQVEAHRNFMLSTLVPKDYHGQSSATLPFCTP